MSDPQKTMRQRSKQNDRANFDRCVNSLMRHLEEQRAALSTENLDDQQINKARDLARNFVIAETGPDPASHIYNFNKTDILEFCNDGGFYHVLPDEAYLVWQTENQTDLRGKVLNILVMLAQNSVPTRRRKELAHELRDRASDYVELLTGEPWNLAKAPKSHKPRNDEPSKADLENGRQVLVKMATKNPKRDAFREALNDAGFKMSNAKAGHVLRELKNSTK